MAEKSAESYISLKGNDEAISIIQNVIKVMVALKIHTHRRKTFRQVIFFFRKKNALQLKKGASWWI